MKAEINQQRSHKAPKDTKMNQLELAKTLIDQATVGEIDHALVDDAITHAPTGASYAIRSIEQEINRAIAEGRPLRRTRHGRATSQVKATKTEGRRTVRHVYLHGNLIAVVIGSLVVANVRVFEAWPTVTTASRLRALGLSASIRKGEAVLDSPVVYNSAFAFA